jgi:hypothetical protein
MVLALSEGKGKPWETKPETTRKPRQRRHFGVTRTNVAHYPFSGLGYVCGSLLEPAGILKQIRAEIMGE